MHDQKGMTMIELVMVISVALLILTAAAAYSIPWIARESMRRGIYDVQTYIQLARIEAISRNRPCRFVVQTNASRISVFDTNGTANVADDILLYQRDLPGTVTFARPDLGNAVTLSQIGASSSYQTIFNSDGTVRLGNGMVALFGGQSYGRISVFVAGGTQVEKWQNGAWHAGS